MDIENAEALSWLKQKWADESEERENAIKWAARHASLGVIELRDKKGEDPAWEQALIRKYSTHKAYMRTLENIIRADDVLANQAVDIYRVPAQRKKAEEDGHDTYRSRHHREAEERLQRIQNPVREI